MVADLFGVPVADLERESSMSSACVYSWENDDETERLDVEVKVSDVDENAEGAASNFRSVTRGMSGAGVDRAMAGVKEKAARSEEHMSELQSLMRISYAVFCL